MLVSPAGGCASALCGYGERCDLTWTASPTDYAAPASSAAQPATRGLRVAASVVMLSYWGSILTFPRWAQGTAPADAFVALAIGACAALGFWRRIRLPASVWVAVWLLLVSGLLAVLGATGGTAAAITIAKLAFLFAWAALGSAVVRSAMLQERMTHLYGLVLLVAAVLVLLTTQLTRVPVARMFVPTDAYRATGTLANPNMAASFLVVGMFLLPVRRSLPGIVVGIGGRIAIFAGTLATGSFAGLQALLAGGVWWAVAHVAHRGGRRANSISIALGFAVLALMALASLVPQAAAPLTPVADSIFPERDFGSSLRDRVVLTSSALALWRAAPWFGGGAGLIEERRAQAGFGAAGGHNEYATTLAERGVVGFLGLMVLLAASLAHALRAANTGSREFGAVGIRQSAALVALCAYAMSHDFIHHRQLWVLLMTIWALPVVSPQVHVSGPPPQSAPPVPGTAP